MSHYAQSPWKDDPSDPVRLFIRRNRKKILIFIAIASVLIVATLVAFAAFFFTVVVPAGSGLAKQAVQSAGEGGSFSSFINWVQQTLGNTNFMQWVTLLLQFNN